MLKCKRSEIFMCLHSVNQQKEGLRIHMETDGIMNTQQLLFTAGVFLLCFEYNFISCRFCMAQI